MHWSRKYKNLFHSKEIRATVNIKPWIKATRLNPKVQSHSSLTPVSLSNVNICLPQLFLHDQTSLNCICQGLFNQRVANESSSLALGCSDLQVKQFLLDTCIAKQAFKIPSYKKKKYSDATLAWQIMTWATLWLDTGQNTELILTIDCHLAVDLLLIILSIFI